MKDLEIIIKKYKRQLQTIKEELATLPDGRLVKKVGYYYHIVGNKSVSIGKDIARVRQLLRKNYY